MTDLAYTISAMTLQQEDCAPLLLMLPKNGVVHLKPHSVGLGAKHAPVTGISPDLGRFTARAVTEPRSGAVMLSTIRV